MVKTICLDYNSILKIRINISSNTIKYKYLCSYQLPIKSVFIDNINSITSVNYDSNNVYFICINDNPLLKINIKTGNIKLIKKLASFELRQIGQNNFKFAFLEQPKMSLYKPITDVHTHFSGALTAKSIVKIALKHNTYLTKQILSSIGIYDDKYGDGIFIKELSSKELNTLKDRLIVSPISQDTFINCEKVYSIRGYFTKNKELFEDLLTELVYDYKRQGIHYAELSFASIVDDEFFLNTAMYVLPKLEKKTNVTIRFLASIWKHSLKIERAQELEKIQKYKNNKYIVGCDFMGREILSTLELKNDFKHLLQMKLEDFTIRVHAGENKLYCDNVKNVLKTILELCKELNIKLPKVRIGHGIYIVDKETLLLCKKIDAIVEFNISSNYALNHINDLSQIPIKKYLDEDIKVVLGMDGHGIYSTCMEQETILAYNLGLTSSDFMKIKNAEKIILKNASKKDNNYNNMKSNDYIVKYSRKTNEKIKMIKHNNKITNKKLVNKLIKKNIITSNKIIEKNIKNKIPIAIIGPSIRGFNELSKSECLRLDKLLKDFIFTLDSNKYFIVTGGVSSGVEGIVHKYCKIRKDNNNKIDLLGLLTETAGKEGRLGPLTYGRILQDNGVNVKSWYDMPNSFVKYIDDHNGIIVCIGGGAIVSDIIQEAYNNNVKIQLMSNVRGSALDESIYLKPENKFSNIGELLSNIKKIK